MNTRGGNRMRVFVFRIKAPYLFLIVFTLFVALFLPWLYQPLATAVMTVTNQNRLVPIYRVDTKEKKVAISFDATWGTDLTDEILSILREHDIKTTFFLAGYWVDKYPEYVVKIAEEGHEIGNHSYSHPHMNSLTFEGVVKELQKNHAMIKDLSGQDSIVFRPPFGEYNNTVIKAAESIGYYTIQWSIDSLDWQNTTSNEVYSRVMSKIGPGEIVLFHNAAKATPDAIRRIIPELKAQGYNIVPVSELIYKENYYIAHDGTQRIGEN